MEVEDLFKKYNVKLGKQISEDKVDIEKFSREYQQFKREMSPELTKYENWCQKLGNLIKVKASKKDEEKIEKYLKITHLDITPSQAISLAVVALILTFFLGILLTIIIFLTKGVFSILLVFLTLVTSLFIFYYLYKMPARLANKWRLKASSQMVPCILYVVIYMRHTSNLERAIAFAASQLQPPLSLDLRKVFWDVQTGKYSTIKESLEGYLEVWRDDNIEFVESFHLIESSLYEPSEERRIQILEKSLQVVLDGVYEKMMNYSREIRSPIINTYMLGVVLPTLGIVLVPFASTLLKGLVKWYHLFVFFNLIIPFFVFYIMSEVLLKRPGGYGETEALELNPNYEKFKRKRPYVIAFFMVLPLLILGLLPFIFQFTSFPELLNLKKDYRLSELGISFFGDAKIFDFKEVNGQTIGPFGPIALILSLFIPLGIALFFSIAYNMKTKEIIKYREDSKKLEQEFTNSLFQLGNRLGDGIPAEIAFSYLIDSTRGQKTEGFFRAVTTNIQQLGMSVENAIFDEKRGAIIYYPSAIVSSSMRILVESVKKGLQVAARSLMSISEYVKNIHKINERLRDLLAEVVSDMKSNMVFLSPLLAGIVVGLGGMITSILNRLQTLFELQSDGGVVNIDTLRTITDMFNLDKMIPPYFLQLSIGIFIIQSIFILSSTLVTIDSGEDRLRKIYETGRNLKRGVIIYFFIALISVLALSILAGIAIGGLGV